MTFPIERGGLARSFKGVTAKRRVQQELHGLAITAQGDRTVKELAAEVTQKQVMSWWNDLRRGHLPVYGSLLRFIDISVALGVPRRTLLKIPSVLHAYIRDQYTQPDSGEWPRIVTGEWPRVDAA